MTSIVRFLRLFLPLVALLGAAQVAAQSRQAPAAAMPALVGPKPTIAVGVIESSGGWGDTNWDVGNGLRSMLTKALENSGRFIMVERANLDQVLNERQLVATRLAGGGAAAPTRMIAAQYLIVGSVTEFGSPSKGGGLNIGGNLLGGVAGLGVNRKTGKVKIDLRIVDARTAQVVDSFTVERSASKTSVGLTGDYKGVSFGGDAFMKTPIGDAVRGALEDAVARVVTALSGGSWEGKVVQATEETVYVNAGSEAGLMPGDKLRVERLADTLTDPDTGAILSEQRHTVGVIVLRALQAKVAEGFFEPVVEGILAERGDYVVFMAR